MVRTKTTRKTTRTIRESKGEEEQQKRREKQELARPDRAGSDVTTNDPSLSEVIPGIRVPCERDAGN
jgi:hypothetical protein